MSYGGKETNIDGGTIRQRNQSVLPNRRKLAKSGNSAGCYQEVRPSGRLLGDSRGISANGTPETGAKAKEAGREDANKGEVDVATLPPLTIPERYSLPTLQSVVLKKRGTLPHVAGVYLVCDEHGEVVYIGQSSNLKGRFKNHQVVYSLCKSYKWENPLKFEYVSLNTYVYWVELPESTEPERRNIELALMKQFNPRLCKEYILARFR